MAITEESRHRLHSRLKETLGEEEAATLMEHLPPVGWADVATKQDVAQLAAATKQDLAHLKEVIDQRFEAVEHRIRSDFFRSQVGLALTLVGTNIALLAIGVQLIDH